MREKHDIIAAKSMNIFRLLRHRLPLLKRGMALEDVATGIPTLALVDLGAFTRTLPDLSHLSGVVIMEDRLPRFVLEYQGYDSAAPSWLNRHGPKKVLSTHQDLRWLVSQLHEQHLEVYLGFWAQVAGALGTTSEWIRAHPELAPLDSRSHDMNPLSYLAREGVTFAEYISRQYQQVAHDFHFDGLFLGDGFNGYRIFQDPEAFRDQRHTIPKWNNFYSQIAHMVHRTNGRLLAYDCMGFPPTEAELHGCDYRGQAYGGLDALVVQTYPHAFGEYWLKKYHGFDFASALDHLKRVKQTVRGTHCRVLYTLEVGDAIEGWHTDREAALHQQEEFDRVADGKLIVWANQMIADLS